MLFVGLALALLGSAAGSRLGAALGVVVVSSTVLVWSTVDAAVDRLLATASAARARLGDWRRRGERGDDGTDRAVETLKRRYAEGELTETEFEERLELVERTDDEEVARLLVETEE